MPMTEKDLQTLALADMGMAEKEFAEAIESLRHWLDRQPHLPHSLSDRELTAFIIGCKSVEKAKTKIDSYFSARNKYNFFQDRDPKLFKIEQLQSFFYLPGVTSEGCRVMMVELPEMKSLPDFSYDQSIKYAMTLLDIDLQDYPHSLGSIILIDGSKLSLEYIAKMSIVSTSQSLNAYQSTMPIRIKGVIWFNAPSMVEMVLNTFIKPFSSEKLKSRIFTYSGDETCLSEHVPLSMLPSNYIGGQSPSSTELRRMGMERISKSRDWLMGPGSEQVNENRRPPSTDSDMVGSFRKLQVD